MRNLKVFSSYLKKNHLQNVAKEYLRIIDTMDISMMKLDFIKQLNQEQLQEMIASGIYSFLTSLELEESTENRNVKVQESDENINSNKVYYDTNPADLAFIYTAQKKAILKFLPDFTNDIQVVIGIVQELEDYYIQVLNKANKLLFEYQQETENVLKESKNKLKQNSRELNESEEQFRLMVENVKDYAILMIDNTGHSISWNRGAENMFGYSETEIIGKHISVFFTPFEIKRGEPENNLALAKKNGWFENEGWRVRKDNSKFWADIIITSLPDESGKSKGFSMIIHDITANKKVHEELKTSRNFLNSVIENIPNMIFIKDAKELNYVRLNYAGEKLLGYSRKEMIGKNDFDFFPKKEADFFMDKDKAVLKKRKLQEIPQESVTTKKKGIRILETKKIPLFDNHGKPQYLLGISNDITERIKAEQKFKALLESAPDAMIIVNHLEEIVLVNFQAEKLFGYKREELYGNTIELLIPNGFKNFPISQRENYFVKPQTQEMSARKEFVGKKKDGTEFSAEISLSPIENEQGTWVSSAIRDITERKNAEAELKKKSEELAKSNIELEQFAYIASHDLQEPLRMVSSYVQLLANRYKDKLDQDANDFINFAIDGSQRMRNLINSLLEYSRVNRIKPFEWIDMNNLMKEVLLNLSDSIKENNVTIKIDKLPSFYGDYILVNQLFQNLIANAIKFKGEKNPEITISGKKIKDEFLFSIIDNGIGIQKEYSEKIFIIFKRLHTQEKYPGTGIGLSICKKIVERHDGKIWVEPGIKEGSAFHFTIKENLKSPA